MIEVKRYIFRIGWIEWLSISTDKYAVKKKDESKASIVQPKERADKGENP